MAGGVIREASPRDCWKSLTRQITDYWGRLAAAGSGRGLIAIQPSLRPSASEREGEVTLSGDVVRRHEPMATTEEVADLFERTKRNAVLVGAPTMAAITGIQQVRIEEEGKDRFTVRTSSYKYCLFVRAPGASQLHAPSWSAMRLESDSRIGWNSWLLNHPIHHLQFGFCDELRLISPTGRSLISFVDAALRLFVPDVWGEMYPSLYLELREPSGRFAPFTQRSTGPDIELRESHAQQLRELLRKARADGLDWYGDLEQWREDVDAASDCAPELFDIFMEREAGT